MSRAGDTAFAFLHLGLLLGLLGFAAWSFFAGRAGRGAVLLAFLAAWTWFVLRPGIEKDVARRRAARKRR